MEINIRCHCCLARPPDKLLTKPYTLLGKTEIFSDMLKECFEINLTMLPNYECGICEVCVGRLRDAINFKLQVQRSQKELRDWLDGATCVKDEPVVKSEISDAGYCAKDEDIIYEEVENVKAEMIEDPLPVAREVGLLLEPKHVPASNFAKEISLLGLAKSEKESVRYHKRCREAATDGHDAGGVRSDQVNKKADSQNLGLRADTRTYTCDICNRQFSHKRVLVNHIHTHKGEKHFSYTVCNKQFKSNSLLELHGPSHASEKTIGCPECDRLFKHRINLYRHILLCHKEKPYRCSECNQEFTQRVELIRHKRVHTVENQYKCQECYKQFTDPTVFKIHIRLHSEYKLYICDICEKQFKSKSGIISHIGKHMELNFYDCKICLMKFTYAYQLYRHRQVHTGKKNVCHICNIGFREKRQLTSHIMLEHKGLNPYSCEYCNAQLTSRTGLNRHKKNHTGGKAHICNICDKQFMSKQRFVEHERTHTGDKPYCCDKCGKRFAKEYNLSTHLKIHVVGEIYACELCSKSYATREGLRQHKRIHTKDKVNNKLCIRKRRE